MKHILDAISEVEVPAGLREGVFFRINEEKKALMKRKKLLFQLGFMLSIVGVLSGAYVFVQQILASDFLTVASLGFTDMATLGQYWQEYMLSLLETFPVLSLAIMLTPIFFLLLLTRSYVNQLSPHSNLYFNHKHI